MCVCVFPSPPVIILSNNSSTFQNNCETHHQCCTKKIASSLVIYILCLSNTSPSLLNNICLCVYCNILSHDQAITPLALPVNFQIEACLEYSAFSCWRENQTITAATKLTYSYSNETSWISHLLRISSALNNPHLPHQGVIRCNVSSGYFITFYLFVLPKYTVVHSKWVKPPSKSR